MINKIFNQKEDITLPYNLGILIAGASKAISEPQDATLSILPTIFDNISKIIVDPNMSEDTKKLLLTNVSSYIAFLLNDNTSTITTIKEDK